MVDMIEHIPQNLPHPEDVLREHPEQRLQYALEDYFGNEVDPTSGFVHPSGNIGKNPKLMHEFLEEVWHRKDGKLVRAFGERYALDDFPPEALRVNRETMRQLNNLTSEINATYGSIRENPSDENLSSAAARIIGLVEEAKALVTPTLTGLREQSGKR